MVLPWAKSHFFVVTQVPIYLKRVHVPHIFVLAVCFTNRKRLAEKRDAFPAIDLRRTTCCRYTIPLRRGTDCCTTAAVLRGLIYVDY